jgi:hypothetical protein
MSRIVLEKNCERLEMLRADVGSELGPVSGQLIKAIADGLSDVELTLRTGGDERQRKTMRGRVRRFRSFFSPRMGMFVQRRQSYPAKKLRLSDHWPITPPA